MSDSIAVVAAVQPGEADHVLVLAAVQPTLLAFLDITPAEAGQFVLRSRQISDQVGWCTLDVRDVCCYGSSSYSSRSTFDRLVDSDHSL